MSRRARFRRSPRSSAFRRFASSLGLAVVAVVAVTPLHEPVAAQTLDFTGYHACLRADLGSVDDAPPNSAFDLMDPAEALVIVWTCSAEIGNTVLVPVARDLLGAFTLIFLVWTGIKFMFSGQLELATVLSAVLLVGFAWMMLDNYYELNDAIWGDLGTPTRPDGLVFLIAETPLAISNAVLDDTKEQFVSGVQAANENLSTRQRQLLANMIADPDDRRTSSTNDPDATEDTVADGFINIISAYVYRFLIWLVADSLELLLWLIGWLIYAQYLWGFFGLAICSLIGPIFIPFVLVQQLDFLFWGWFRAMLQCAVYMLMSAALYAVTATILLAPVRRLSTMPLPAEEGGLVGVVEFGVRLALEYVPLVILSIFGALKVGSLSAGIMAGSAPGEAGLGSALASGSRGLSRLAGGSSAAAGAVPVSTLTGEAGVQRAYAETRSRLGVGALSGAKGADVLSQPSPKRWLGGKKR